MLAAARHDPLPDAATIELHVGPGVDASTLKFVPSSPDAAMSAAGEVPLDRDSLVDDLGGLDHGNFSLLVAMVPGAARSVSYLLPVPTQAAMLIAWAESSKGPGLPVLARALSRI